MSSPRLPADIRLMVLDILLQDGCSLANFATVSREWQTIIERHNFSQIKLTSPRLANFGLMIDRNRSLVRHIWLCLELQEYDCTKCEPQDPDLWGLSDADNTLIVIAFQHLFSTLSAWKPAGNLLLDISIYSPSDSKHSFKYLTFEPDITSDIYGWDQYAEQSMLVKAIDHHHGWIAGSQYSIPTVTAIQRIFERIMNEGPFDNEEQEGQWWQQLPLVPAVTGVLLRQQSRRRWKPAALAHLFARLPRLQEIHYEPWREWCNIQQKWTDKALRLLFESLASDRLRRLILFENFNQTYPASYMGLYSDAVRIPCSYISRAIASTSLSLEHLSASFIVDASDFFNARQLSWKWPNMTWLALTSRRLIPEESPIELDEMLQAAAAAAMKMPNLKIMEIWNGMKGLAMLFRYQRGQPAILTCRGTWELTLRPHVIQAWNSVGQRFGLYMGNQCVVIVKELLDAGACVKSHGDAIRHLKLSRPVIRPISLRQIQMEHMIRERMQS